MSTAGGLATSIGRATELGANAMQIFNQSPRMWRPTKYTEEDFEAFRLELGRSPIESVVIHAVYLINCASKESEIRKKSIASLKQALTVGDGIGADGVVLHPGSTKGEPLDEAIGRIAHAVAEAISATSSCPVLFENTAGAGGTVGRNFSELSELVGRTQQALGGRSKRVGVCLDSCHLFASGIDFSTRAECKAMVDSFERTVGRGRLRCVHLNDSKMPLGSNRDRHENLGDGQIGRSGIKAFLSDGRLRELPVLLEVPGSERKGPDLPQVKLAKRLYRDAVK